MESPVKKINYLQILEKSFRLIWKKWHLWWLGFLVALSSVGTITMQIGDSQPEEGGSKIADYAERYPVIFLSIFLAAIIVVIIIWILGLIGRGGLIFSIQKEYSGKKTCFREGFVAGKKLFWKILAIDLSLGIALLAIVAVLAVPIIFTFLNQIYWAGIILSILAFLILVPVLFIVSFVKNYGYLYAVLGKINFWSAMENGYFLFRKNMLPSLIMLLFFLGIGIAVVSIIFAVAFPVGLFFFAFGAALFFVIKTTGIIIATILGIIFVLILILIIQSAYQTFIQAVWVLFFHEIAKPKLEEGAEEKIIKTKPAIEPDVV